MTINWSEIENKWRSKWQENKDFETNPNDKPKKFITVAYPYPNSPQHIGHGRTYTLADVHARFYRMKGYNVLFPMGFQLITKSALLQVKIMMNIFISTLARS